MSQERTTQILEESIGSTGGQYVTGTSEVTPNSRRFIAIQAIEDTTISSVTGNIDVSGAILLAGTIIYGKWSAITLTSGKCIAYEGA